jgi:hypothetical protein
MNRTGCSIIYISKQKNSRVHLLSTRETHPSKVAGGEVADISTIADKELKSTSGLQQLGYTFVLVLVAGNSGV